MTNDELLERVDEQLRKYRWVIWASNLIFVLVAVGLALSVVGFFTEVRWQGVLGFILVVAGGCGGAWLRMTIRRLRLEAEALQEMIGEGHD